MTASRADAFGPAARRLAGLAGAVLGWPPDRFWEATPADLAAVVAVLTGGDGIGGGGAMPLDKALMVRLQERFPDG